MYRNKFDVYVVMVIGQITSSLYDENKIPTDFPYEEIVYFVERELEKGEFYKYCEEQTDKGEDLPTIVHDWFEHRILKFVKEN